MSDMADLAASAAMTVKELRGLSEGCDKAADFLVDKPGLQGPSHVIDLYRTCAVLAAEIARIKEAAVRTQGGGFYD